MGLYPCSLDVVIYIVCIRTKNCNKLPDPKYCGFAPEGGVLDISLGGEVRRGPSYPDPV